MPGDLVDYGSFDAECHLDPTAVLLPGATGTVEIAVPASTTDPKVWGSAFVSALNYTMPFEDKMMCGYTFTWTQEFNIGTTS